MTSHVIAAILAVLASASMLFAGDIGHLGRGCTTATYIDKDCDGYGVGKKSSAVYAVGNNTTYSTGDLPDADDEDPTVNTTASWEAKWGTGNAGMVSFLQQRKAFTNTGRIFYVSRTGDNATAVVNDRTRPYRNLATIRAIIKDLQGGVIVIRGGNWGSQLVMAGSSDGGPWSALTGTVSKPLYVMAYPGEKVETAHAESHDGTPVAQGGAGAWPQENLRYVTLDGIMWTSAGYNLGDAIHFIDVDHVTVRNCEFAGWHQGLFFGNHSEDITIEDNVFHDDGTHAIYLGWSGYVNPYGEADFNFSDNEAQYVANAAKGASYRATIRNNVFYVCGSSGYEAIHVNCYIDGVVIDGNLISFSAGAIGLQTGVYHAVIRNNAIFDNGRAGITLSLYSGTNQVPASIRYVTIENNTIWGGNHTDAIRNTNPTFAILANDYSAVSGHWIKDVAVRNNVMVTDNYSIAGGNWPISLMRNSYPNTWTIENNLFWSTAPTASDADRVIAIAGNAYPDGQDAGSYTVAQVGAYIPGFRNNLYADPRLKAASTGYTATPWLFDLGLGSGSPAIKAGVSGSATLDIRGITRTVPPDIGAYASASGTGAATGAGPSAPRGVTIK